MPRAVILTDFHRESFTIIGHLYMETFQRIGLEVSHLSTPVSQEERRALSEEFKDSLFFHNTVGKS
ncbi:MAG: hypothetical protein AAGB46_19830, partial [Verrucomicrobiota bacterium]